MLIELQEPFRSKWNKGYLRLSNENRRILDLYNNDYDRTTISYARYLMGVKLGYDVPLEYEVDHRDNDRTNDDINNLQLLTPEQNRLKQEWNYIALIQQWYIVPCSYCNGLFYLTNRQLKMKRAQGVEHEFCSRSCAGRYHNTLKNIDIYQLIAEDDCIKLII